MEGRFPQVGFLLVSGRSATRRAWVVPRAVRKLYSGHISATPHVVLDVINQSGVDNGGVREEVTLLKSVDKDAWGRRNNFDILMIDPIHIEGEEDITSSVLL